MTAWIPPSKMTCRGPGGGYGDGNGDGSPDKNQPNVTSLETHDDSGYVTFDSTATDGTILQNVSAFPRPRSARLPTFICRGASSALKFMVSRPGQTVTMNMFIPRDTSVIGYYDKDKNTGQWENIASAVDHT